MPDLKTWSDRERATYALLRINTPAAWRDEALSELRVLKAGGRVPYRHYRDPLEEARKVQRERVLRDVLHASRGDKRYSAPTLVEVRCHRRNTLVARVVRVQKRVPSGTGLGKGAWWVLLPMNPKGGHWVTLRQPPDRRHHSDSLWDPEPDELLPEADIPGLYQVTSSWGRATIHDLPDRLPLKCCCGVVHIVPAVVHDACHRSAETGKKVTVKALPAGRKRKGKGLDVEKTGPRRQRPASRLHQRG